MIAVVDELRTLEFLTDFVQSIFSLALASLYAIGF